MSKLIDIYLEAVFFVVSIILWLYVLLISSDIPVNISKNEFIISIISLLLFGLFYRFYVRKSKREVIGVPLLIPLAFWLLSMVDAIKYNYQIYNTIISIIGFTITGYCIGLSIHRLLTKKHTV
ncbi:MULTISPECIES: hypothetical protein [Clostridium]|jgi:sugar phosphate permease|uniref:hypothetical protein n=1 Tax=Clostridium TaxID=1485 RepID=UPI00082307C9|nr:MULTISPECIES: hypothetical protein [Clostridium]MBX9184464.1 hypothetical protein [Clostridium sp. K04]SCJ61139.1 Uncharacterised protein [uncultured Clostridium sp.]